MFSTWSLEQVPSGTNVLMPNKANGATVCFVDIKQTIWKEIFFCLFCAIILIRKSFGLNSLCRFLCSIEKHEITSILNWEHQIYCMFVNRKSHFIVPSPPFPHDSSLFLQEQKKTSKPSILESTGESENESEQLQQKSVQFVCFRCSGEPSRNGLLRK